MDYKKGLVSIIIPTYNREEFISDAILSCLNQTYKNIEIIVIDDGSTDNTKTILEDFTIRYNNKIKYFSKENSGVSSARNFGISLSRGEFIQFLDSDDLIDQTKLEKQVKCLNKNKDIFGVYCGTRYFKDTIDNIIFNNFFKCSINCYKNLLEGNFIPIHSIIVRRCNIIFDESLSYFEDWEFWLRVLENKKISYIDEYLCYVRVHNTNTSRNRKEMTICEINILKKLRNKCKYLDIINFSLYKSYYIIDKKSSYKYLIKSIKFKKIYLLKFIKFIIKFYWNNDVYQI